MELTIFVISFIIGLLFVFTGEFGIGILIIVISSAIYYFVALKDDDNKQKEAEVNRINISNKLKESGFSCDKSLTFPEGNISFKVDYTNKRVAILDFNYNTINFLNFNQIIDFEVVENNETIYKGGLKRAIVGDIIAGVPGAIIGVMTRKSSSILTQCYIKIFTTNTEDSLFKIELLPYKQIESLATGSPFVTKIDTKENSDIYDRIVNFVNETSAILKNILYINSTEKK